MVAVEGGGPGVIDGRVLPEGPGLVVFDPMGRVSATASLEVRPVALAAGPDGGIYVIGHQAPDSPDKVPTLLAFDAKLEFRWRRHLGREALTALAVDDQGRVHVYGESRGGDYGAGEMPDPKASWAKTGAVVVTLDSVGTLVLARGLPSHEAVVAMGVEGDAIVVITPGGMMSRIGESPDEDQSASLTTPSPTPTPPRYTVRGGAWLGDRFRLGVQQNGTVIWNAETTNRSAGVLVDGVLDP